mgnify:CR=1 FL=1
MKKVLITLIFSSILISPTLSDDNFSKYSRSSLNENIFKFNWKIDKVRSTSTQDIYYLTNNKRLLNCIVTLVEDYIDTYCREP